MTRFPVAYSPTVTWQIAGQVTDAAREIQFRTPTCRLYVHCEPGVVYLLDQDEPSPLGSEPVTCEPIPCHLDRYLTVTWLQNHLRHAPMLPEC